jgi:tetratricopeptide (TPR) repeat protein
MFIRLYPEVSEKVGQYQVDEKTRAKKLWQQQAIRAALEGQWDEAVNANLNIVALFPNDVEAYNRLGKAYLELGKYEQALQSYEESLKLEPHNLVARRNAELIRMALERQVPRPEDAYKQRKVLDTHIFIEEVGKSGVVDLVDLADLAVLLTLSPGQRLELRLSGSKVLVYDQWDRYIGRLEPKIGSRLASLMAGGNRYEAAVLVVQPEAVKVMVKEVYQDPSQVGRVSFRVKPIPVPARVPLKERMVVPEEEEEEFVEEELLEEEEEELEEKEISLELLEETTELEDTEP